MLRELDAGHNMLQLIRYIRLVSETRSQAVMPDNDGSGELTSLRHQQAE